MPLPNDHPNNPDHGLLGRLVVTSAALAVVVGAGGALPGGSAGDTTATVTNSAPVIKTVSLPSTTLTPTAGGTTTTTATIEVEDLNGCDDLMRVEAQVNDTAGNQFLGPTNLSTGGYDSCTSGLATYTYSFDMQYWYEPATDLTTDAYGIYVEAEDKAGASTNNDIDIGSILDFKYEELTALNLDTTTLDFGSSIDPGTTSAVVQLGVDNHGNVQIDADVSGADLGHATESATISVSNVEYNLTNDRGSASSLSSTATTITAFDLAAGSGSSDTIYWWLTVPSGSNQHVPSGDYTGTVTVSAVKG